MNLTFKDAAAKLAVSVRTLQRIVARGEIRTVRVSVRAIRIPEQALVEYERRYDAACRSVNEVTRTRSASRSQGEDALSAVFRRELQNATPRR